MKIMDLRGNAAADRAEAEAQALRGLDVEHQLHPVAGVITIAVGGALCRINPRCS
ncbi:hypothetical protein C4K22_0743 [Pseudomonas chlororaphis subsp. aurantiaca]|nr:hypothetical protein C4K22_0743 [Pseudomonas chlororaphis subsp. aurantiaca]AZD39845.1 hypothetical protein C4K21_0744 [Pseudomonas chlororaphis subsp. aurantiaca]